VAVTLPPALPHPTGVPQVGDVYWVDTFCYGGNKKPTRPLVVVRGPVPGLLDDVIIICRTSAEEFSSMHVKHPADPSVGLNKDGIFPKAYLWGSITRSGLVRLAGWDHR
jgi:hypothetical protein